MKCELSKASARMNCFAACTVQVLSQSCFSCTIPLQINGQTHCQCIPLGYDDSSGSGPHSWHMLWYVVTRAQLYIYCVPFLVSSLSNLCLLFALAEVRRFCWHISGTKV